VRKGERNKQRTGFSSSHAKMIELGLFGRKLYRRDPFEAALALITVTRSGIRKTAPSRDFAVLHCAYVDPLTLKRFLGIACRHLAPSEDRDMFSGFDEFPRFEENRFVGLPERLKKFGDLFSVHPQTRIGQTRWSNELPVGLFGNQIQYRRKVPTTVCFVSLFYHIERGTRFHFSEGEFASWLTSSFIAKPNHSSIPRLEPLRFTNLELDPGLEANERMVIIGPRL
jgi:hypothetical protein